MRRRLSDEVNVTENENSDYSDRYCIAGAYGPLCSKCRATFYFNEDEERCASCSGFSPTRFQFALYLLFMLLLAAIALKYSGYCNVARMENLAGQAREASRGADSIDAAIGQVQDEVKSRVKERVSSVASQAGDQANHRVSSIRGTAVENLTHKLGGKIHSVEEKLLKRWHKIAPKLKIMITFTQLVSGFGFVLSFKFPGIFNDVLNIADGLNLNLFKVAPFPCFFPETGFFEDLVVSTMYPIILSMVLLSLHWWTNRRKKADEERSHTFWTLFLVLSYLVLPGTASKTFSAFRVDDFTEGYLSEVVHQNSTKFEYRNRVRKFLTVDYDYEWKEYASDPENPYWYVCRCKHVQAQAHARMYTHVHAGIRTSTHTPTRTSDCAHTLPLARLRARSLACTHARTHARMHERTHARTNAHTGS